MIHRNKVADVRSYFIEALRQEEFVIDKTGVKLIELVGASFIADEETIFGRVNEDYVSRELEWYRSMSLSVEDIPGGAPSIWKQVADENGFINSNYGWCVWSPRNHNQYQNVLRELKSNPSSRRTTMIYTRPTMWIDYNRDGMSDFMCTNAVGYLVREGKLHCHVQMRSNDVWAGYRNDRAWQKYLLDQLSKDLGVEPGDIHWTVTSLHVYEKQFHLVKEKES